MAIVLAVVSQDEPSNYCDSCRPILFTYNYAYIYFYIFCISRCAIKCLTEEKTKQKTKTVHRKRRLLFNLTQKQGDVGLFELFHFSLKAVNSLWKINFKRIHKMFVLNRVLLYIKAPYISMLFFFLLLLHVNRFKFDFVFRNHKFTI